MTDPPRVRNETGIGYGAVLVAILIAYAVKAPLTWQWLRASIPGGVCFAIAQTLGFASFQETSLAIAAIISWRMPDAGSRPRTG